MKRILSLAIMVLIATAAQAQQKGAFCTANGESIVFGEDQNGSLGIQTRVARLQENISLSLHYNIYYEVGGSLDLLGPQGRLRMLRWDTPYETNILYNSTRVGDVQIECEIR